MSSFLLGFLAGIATAAVAAVIAIIYIAKKERIGL